MNYLAIIQGGIGPDVWDEEKMISAVDFADASTQAIGLAQESNGHVVTLEQAITGTEPPSIVARIESAAISSVLSIRCGKHYMVPQQNKNEHSGGECGGCIAEERDHYKIQYQAFKVACDLKLDAINSAREILRPLANSVNPSVLAIREALFILR